MVLQKVDTLSLTRKHIAVEIIYHNQKKDRVQQAWVHVAASGTSGTAYHNKEEGGDFSLIHSKASVMDSGIS